MHYVTHLYMGCEPRELALSAQESMKHQLAGNKIVDTDKCNPTSPGPSQSGSAGFSRFSSYNHRTQLLARFKQAAHIINRRIHEEMNWTRKVVMLCEDLNADV